MSGPEPETDARQDARRPGTRLGKRVALALRIAASLAFMGYLFYSIDLETLATTLKNADPAILAALVVIVVPLGYFVSTVKWRILLSVHGFPVPSLGRLWALYFVGTFFSNFLPTEVGGDLVRSYEVGKVSGHHSESLAAVLMERLTGFLALLLVAVSGLLLNLALPRARVLAPLIAGIAVVFVLFVVFLMSEFFHAWVVRRIRLKLVHRIAEKTDPFFRAVRLYRGKRRTLAISLALSLLFQFVPIVYTYGIARALGLEIPYGALVLVLPAAALISLIPISLNGIGLREGAFVFLLTDLAIDPADALAVALAFRIGTMLVSSVGGVLYAAMNVSDYRERGGRS